MKKLFILMLAPAMLLTAMSSADQSIVRVMIAKDGSRSELIEIPVDWQTDTLQSFAQKVWKSPAYQYYMAPQINYFTWGANILDSLKKGNIHEADLTKLSDVIPEGTKYIQANTNDYLQAKQAYGK